jgi:hypothetical protein
LVVGIPWPFRAKIGRSLWPVFGDNSMTTSTLSDKPTKPTVGQPSSAPVDTSQFSIQKSDPTENYWDDNQEASNQSDAQKNASSDAQSATPDNSAAQPAEAVDSGTTNNTDTNQNQASQNAETANQHTQNQPTSKPIGDPVE